MDLDLPSVTPLEFKVGTRVELTGLKQAEFNGRVGIIQSRLDAATGRQQVALEKDLSFSTANRVLGLKPTNLLYAPRSVESLTVRELKIVLNTLQGGGSSHSVAGLDKGQLRELVSKQVDSDQRIAAILSQESPSSSDEISSREQKQMDDYYDSSKQFSAEQMHAQAQQLANTSPDQLRQQAKMMRSMDPNMIRRMNPNMAHFSDSQIRMAADQLEMMAKNPSMMQSVLDQMKNMSPQELEQARQMHMGSPSFTPSTSSSAQVHRQQMQEGAQNMANMTPDEIRQQAQRLRSTDPDFLRRMNPAMKNLTDTQIEQVISQMESMADKPQLVQSMAQQMQHMTSDDWDHVQDAFSHNVGAESKISTIPKLEKTQIQQTIQIMKSNPAMVRDMIRLQHPNLVEKLSDEQLDQMLSSFAKMDDTSVDRMIRGFTLLQQTLQFLKKRKTILWGIILVIFVFVSYIMGFHLPKMIRKRHTLMTNIPTTDTNPRRVFQSDENEFHDL